MQIYKVTYLPVRYRETRVSYFRDIKALYENFSRSFLDLQRELGITKTELCNDIVNIVNTHTDYVRIEVV